MFDHAFFDYELLDFGRMRRLERFGAWILDRESPFAGQRPLAFPGHWREAAMRFDIGTGRTGTWRNVATGKPLAESDPPESWTIGRPPFCLELRRSPFGHPGVFPEQIPVWNHCYSFIRRRTERRVTNQSKNESLNGAAKGTSSAEPIRVLNLFAYTGGSTLAAAAAGAAVTHVDAASSTIVRARRNAELSRLADAPIRWITEDVRRFVQRELRRGAAYDIVILDPPAYGYGGKREAWRIDHDLPDLLRDCVALTRGCPMMIALSAHSPGYDARQLSEMLYAALGGTKTLSDGSAMWKMHRHSLAIPRSDAASDSTIPCLDAGEIAILESND